RAAGAFESWGDQGGGADGGRGVEGGRLGGRVGRSGGCAAVPCRRGWGSDDLVPVEGAELRDEGCGAGGVGGAAWARGERGVCASAGAGGRGAVAALLPRVCASLVPGPVA